MSWSRVLLSMAVGFCVGAFLVLIYLVQLPFIQTIDLQTPVELVQAQHAKQYDLGAKHAVLRQLATCQSKPLPKCPEPEVVPHSCTPDPEGGDCAVSWGRLLESRRGRYKTSCGDSWVIRWKRRRQRD